MASIKINGDTSGSTTITAPATGSDETIELSTALDAKAPLASPTFTGTVALPATTTLDGATLAPGKILQVVRAADGTQRNTTSTSFTDVTGLSVTITPTKSDSAILLTFVALGNTRGNGRAMDVQITDSSNNAISGAEGMRWTISADQGLCNITVIGYATPATTSPVTYKARFKSSDGNEVRLNNEINTGQLFAYEVAA